MKLSKNNLFLNSKIINKKLKIFRVHNTRILIIRIRLKIRFRRFYNFNHLIINKFLRILLNIFY